MTVRSRFKYMALSFALATVSVVTIGGLLGAAATGAIDGPSRGGNDMVELAVQPNLFWFSVAIYVLLAVLTGGGAIAYWRKGRKAHIPS